MAYRDNKPGRREEEKDDLIKKLVSINRVTKVVKAAGICVSPHWSL
jgi:ribosomal protein S5